MRQEGVAGSVVLTRVGFKVLSDCIGDYRVDNHRLVIIVLIIIDCPTRRVVAQSFDPRLAKCNIFFFSSRNGYHPRGFFFA
ncbi:hypothetical protein Hanom_Chr01g00045271 [Helianthus anomalus]